MDNYEFYTGRLFKTEGKNVYEVGISDDEIVKCYPKGYAIPRFNLYQKHCIEGFVELCILELNSMEYLLESKLLHITKGLLHTLSFMTNPEECISWKEHKFLQSDVEKIEELITKSFNFDCTLPELKHFQSRKQFIPIWFTVGKDLIVTGITEQETSENFAWAFAIPHSKDQRFSFVYLVRMLHKFISGLKPERTISWDTNKYDYSSGQTDLEIHEEWMFYLKIVGGALIYLVNCVSWRQNELKIFDEIELSGKLSFLIKA